MRISGRAVIAGLALVVIVPSTVQASRLADTREPVSRQTSLGRDVHPPFLEFSEGGTLTFQSTDLMVWSDGKAFVSTSGRAGRQVWNFTLSRSRLERLKSALRQARFRTLRSRYVGECADCGVYSITYAGRTVRSAQDDIWSPSARWAVVPRRLAAALRLLSHLADAPHTR